MWTTRRPWRDPGLEANAIGSAETESGTGCEPTARSPGPEVVTRPSPKARTIIAAAASAGAPEPEVKISEGTPSLWNDEELAARVAPVFRRVLGEANVTEAEPSMGGEDFSRYGQAGVPILMFRLGAVSPERRRRALRGRRSGALRQQ